MTKKHYEAIAQALRSSKPATDIAAKAQWMATATSVMDAIKSFNPLFDQGRFEQAAGIH